LLTHWMHTARSTISLLSKDMNQDSSHRVHHSATATLTCHMHYGKRMKLPRSTFSRTNFNNISQSFNSCRKYKQRRSIAQLSLTFLLTFFFSRVRRQVLTTNVELGLCQRQVLTTSVQVRSAYVQNSKSEELSRNYLSYSY